MKRGGKARLEPYPTPEELAIAEANGISKPTVLQRIRKKKNPWTMERAITEKPHKHPQFFTDEELRIMRQHGVHPNLAKSRIEALHWDKERAMTEELGRTSKDRRKR